MTQTGLPFHPWQFTGSMAGSGPDQGGAVLASGPVEEDPAFVVVRALLERATSRGSNLLAD